MRNMEKKRIILIAAVDDEFGIGCNGRIPWNVPGDRAFFRNETSGHVCLFGRKTYESLGRRTLPNRVIGVLTHDSSFEILDVERTSLFCANDLGELLIQASCRSKSGKIYICGGGQVYAQLMNRADEVVLSRIEGRFSCDTFFPKIPETFTLCRKETGVGFAVERWKMQK